MIDVGRNTILENGEILEVGKMINPATGKMTSYEESWEELAVDGTATVFVRNVSGTRWQGQVGNWQMGMGWDSDGKFWAWQAKASGSDWTVLHSTANCANSDLIMPLPDDKFQWIENGPNIVWQAQEWQVLELNM